MQQTVTISKEPHCHHFLNTFIVTNTSAAERERRSLAHAAESDGGGTINCHPPLSPSLLLWQRQRFNSVDVFWLMCVSEWLSCHKNQSGSEKRLEIPPSLECLQRKKQVEKTLASFNAQYEATVSLSIRLFCCCSALFSSPAHKLICWWQWCKGRRKKKWRKAKRWSPRVTVTGSVARLWHAG